MTRRSTPRALLAALSLGALALATHGSALAQQEPDENAIIASFTIMGDASGTAMPLPKLAMIPSLSAEMEDVTVNSVARRDLDLCGEFEVMPDSAAPDGAYADKVDAKAWGEKGAEYLVRVTGHKINDTTVELRGMGWIVEVGDDALYDKTFQVPIADVRVESHRLTDLLIGALTGHNGSFASHMTFALGSGGVRQVYTMDADGFNAKSISPSNRVALAPTYGPNEELYYSGSENKDIYKVYNTTSSGALPLNVDGSVYGLTWSKDRSRVAVAIGVSDSIKLFIGPSLDQLQSGSKIGGVLRPQFTPEGKLLFAGDGHFGSRIYIDDKPITPDGIYASSPSYCRSPDGDHIIFSVSVGGGSDILTTGENGGGIGRLTANSGNNTSPACSPDGRLVAFFSNRKSGEGGGLYVMRTDGRHLKRVSTLVGDSLRWDPLPPGKIADPNAVKSNAKGDGKSTTNNVAPPNSNPTPHLEYLE